MHEIIVEKKKGMKLDEEAQEFMGLNGTNSVLNEILKN